MKRIRRRVILLVTWLVGFYSIDKLLEPIDISVVTYLFMMGMMIISLVTPRLARVPFWSLLFVPIPVFYAVSVRIQPLEESIPLFIVESGAILITTLLSYQVSLAISDFELAVAHICIGQHGRIMEDPSTGNGTLYREVRRSRNHHRPLALLAVAIDETSLNINVDRIVQEAQQAMVKQYALSAIASLLCDRLEDCDTIVQNNQHFLVLLPETTPQDLPGLIDRLRQQSAEQIGVDLKIGAASMPEDGYTLEGLVDRAIQGIKTELKPGFFPDLKKMPANQQAYWNRLTAHLGTHHGSGPD